MTQRNQTSGNSPLRVGLRAARANLVPGIFIWILMLAVLIAYYNHTGTRAVLESIAEWKGRYGYGFSFIATGLAGGVLPEVLKVILLQKGKFRRENLSNIVFGFPFWGFLGCVVDAFYRMQAVWFGSEATASVLIKKVLLDQFVFTTLWGTPSIVFGYEWRRLKFRRAGLRQILTRRFYRVRVVPSILAGWAVWIPVVSIVYSLPGLLQVPIFVLATTFWSLIVTFIASSQADEESRE